MSSSSSPASDRSNVARALRDHPTSSTSSASPTEPRVRHPDAPPLSDSWPQKSGGILSRTHQKKIQDGHGHFASLSKLSRSRESGGFLLDTFTDRGKKRQSRHSDNTLLGQIADSNQERRSEPSTFVLPSEPPSNMAQKRRPTPDGKIRASQSSGDRDKDLQERINDRPYAEDGDTIETASAIRSAHRPSVGIGNTSLERALEPSNHGSLSASRNSSIDPAEIVRMALNLNESRKMSLDPGHLASVPAPDSTKSSVNMLQPRDAVLTGSLRQHLKAQSRSSQNSSPYRASLNGTRSNAISPSPPTSNHSSVAVTQDPPMDYIYHITPATISRAEKAKAYIELAHEHRRLLERLPRLEPSDGSRNLERPYNPLQYLRNRTQRVHNSRPLNTKASGWNNVLHVRNWVDLVEQESGQPGYVMGDVALLPEWRYSHLPLSALRSEDNEGKVPRDSKINGSRGQSRMDWAVNPSDLLADAYWLEQADNKTLAETRQGNKIFPEVRRPFQSRTSSESFPGPSKSASGTRHPIHSIDSPESPKEAKHTMSPVVAESERDTDAEESLSSPYNQSRRSKVKRHLLKKPKAPSYSSDDLSNSETEFTRQPPMHLGKHGVGINTGPLERHMRTLLELENLNQNSEPITHSHIDAPRPGIGGSRRLGVSEGTSRPSQTERHEQAKGRGKHMKASRDVHLNTSISTRPTISIDEFDGAPQNNNNRFSKGRRSKSPSLEDVRSSRWVEPKGLGLRFKRHQRLRQHQQSSDDLRHFQRNGQNGDCPGKTGIDVFDGATSRRDSFGPQGSIVESNSTTDQSSPETNGNLYNNPPASKRFFKGGRIGEIVRNESTQASDIVFKRQPPRRGSATSRKPKESDMPYVRKPEKNSKLTRGEKNRPFPGTYRRRSASTSDIHKSKDSQYHAKNLPSFVSNQRNHLSPPKGPGDHMSIQQEQRRLQRNTSRFDSLAPSPLDTSDVSPTNSSPELARSPRPDLEALSLERQRSYGFPRPDEERSRDSSQSGVESANTRLQAALDLSRNSKSSRNSLTPRESMTPSADLDQISWDLARAPSHPIQQRRMGKTIRSRDIALVHSLLLSSGVKGKSIVERANTPRPSPAPYLLEALSAADETDRNPRAYSLDLIPRHQEHVLAAQNLSKGLNATVSAFENAARRFRNNTCVHLSSQIGDLRERVGSQLTPGVRLTSDDADAFIARLTTTHTLAIKQVNDSVDQMMRKRRQRLRWLRRVGFALLEWVLVALMWWIWLFVFIFNCLRTMLTWVFRGVKWLFWL